MLKAIYNRAFGFCVSVDGSLTITALAVTTGITGSFLSSTRLVVVGAFLLLAAISFSAASAALGIHAAAFRLEDIYGRLVAVGDSEVKALARASRPAPAPDPRKPN